GTAVAILAMAAPYAPALDSHPGITQYPPTPYEAHDGLANNLVNSLAQTPDGYLWAGSEEGLTRFDGATFTTYDHRKTEGIPANTFSALAVDPAGVLWAATRDHGLVRLVDGESRAVIWETGAQNAHIRALTFDRDGDLWIGLRDQGVVLLRNGILVAALGSRNGLPADEVRSILAARDGSIWFGTFRGLAQWKAGALVRGPAGLDAIA